MTRLRIAELATRGVARNAAMAAATAGALLGPSAATAQTQVGPGNLGPQSVSSGSLTVVGNTNITGTTATPGLTATGPGEGILDTSAGQITVTNGNNSALKAQNGGTIVSAGPGPLTLSASTGAGGTVEAFNGSLVSLQNATISAQAGATNGVKASGGSFVSLQNSTITESGASGSGVLAN